LGSDGSPPECHSYSTPPTATSTSADMTAYRRVPRRRRVPSGKGTRFARRSTVAVPGIWRASSDFSSGSASISSSLA
jgi:hypothetical protein